MRTLAGPLTRGQTGAVLLTGEFVARDTGVHDRVVEVVVGGGDQHGVRLRGVGALYTGVEGVC